MADKLLLETGDRLLLETNDALLLETGSGGTLTLTWPKTQQINQRARRQADIYIAGTYTGSPTSIEASFNGGAYTTVVASPTGGTFSGTLAAQAQGYGTLTVRFTDNTAITATVSMGIGDVFGIWGQSNASGRGDNNQSYTGSGGLVASMFANDNTWKDLTDPVDINTGQVDTVSSDSPAVTGGSVWPLIATQLIAGLGVPVAFVPCPLGGTRIDDGSSSSLSWRLPADKLDRATLYGSANYRCKKSTLQGSGAGAGIRMVIWWQGESDAIALVSQSAFRASLLALAAQINTDLGVKIMPCVLQNSSSIPDVDEAKINAAIAQTWQDSPYVLTGPTLSDLGSDDGYHLKTNAHLQTAADRWAAKLLAVLRGPGILLSTRSLKGGISEISGGL